MFVLIGIVSENKSQQLSPQAEISLLTVSPGDELYSCFGHSTYFIYDSINKISKVYNYGTFDFDDPNFYSNFVRGKLKYRLNVEQPGQLMMMATEENRSITQQILNLSPAQKQRIYADLEKNALPENKYYKYDFFYDNCSSRLRDILANVCSDSLNFNLKEDGGKSFRNLIDPYLVDKQYQDLGMDLGLGAPADRIATPYQYMFLPNNLRDDFNSATILRGGKKEKLVSSERIVLPAVAVIHTSSFLANPAFAFWSLLLLVVALTFYQYKKDKNGFWLDAILFGFSGLFGLLLLFLWFGTDHGVTAKNYNLIWAFPGHLWAVVYLFIGKNMRRIGSYFLVNFYVLFFLMLFWHFVPQELNLYTLPFILALAIRSLYIYHRFSKDYIYE